MKNLSNCDRKEYAQNSIFFNTIDFLKCPNWTGSSSRKWKNLSNGDGKENSQKLLFRTWIYLTASLQANRYPAMMEVGWIFCLTNSSAFFRSSAATITTDVVPSPTSSSCNWANSTKTCNLKKKKKVLIIASIKKTISRKNTCAYHCLY